MTKKVALVTCYFQKNYGSQLQAYATQLFFDKINVPNETIRIDGLQKEIRHAKYKYFLSRLWDINTIQDKFSTVKKIWALKCKGEEFKKKMSTRNKMFESFSQTMFHLSPTYKSKKDLINNVYSYKAFIVGSDQLWLPSNIEADYYTLNFVPHNIPKISLATSFGVSKLPIAQSKKAIVFLKKLDFCSVRETSGKEIIKKLVGRDVPVVCDPTILFTAQEWNQIISQNRIYNKPYIFCYFLGNNPKQRDLVKKFQKETGYPIIQLQHCDEYIKTDENFADFTPYNIGPLEFIQLIRDAEYVFTDSFHGSVFSLLFKKRFFTFKRYHNDSTTSTNGRIYSLLSSVNLEERLIKEYENFDQVINKDINYDQVDTKLDELRKFTTNFIKEALDKSHIKYDNN